ncbi:MAG TPA: hypothetical protein VHM90_15660 [Phycisphaerae bacterium]|jgi:hypothetical protein|nr:hypothetical protein [Phycisphaerae bacterium]
MAKSPLEPPEEVSKAYDEYAKALGHVVNASNALHETFSRLFWHLSRCPDLRISNAIWHSHISDKGQRMMLRAALESVPEHKWECRLPKARKDLDWLITQADEYAIKRNDAVHAPCVFQYDENISEVVASQRTLNKQARNLANKRLINVFELYASAFGRLNWFTLHAVDALGNNAVSWPRKPAMPTHDQSHYRGTQHRTAGNRG